MGLFKSLADDIRNLVGAIIIAFFVIAIVLYAIVKFITEILLPLLVGLFLIVVAVVLIVISGRLLAHLIAYLTLRKRARRKIVALSKKIFQLNVTDSTLRKQMSAWPSDHVHAIKSDLHRHATTREELEAKRKNVATALANHLANRLDKVNRSQRRLRAKTAAGVSNELSEKLVKKNRKAALLEIRINRLKARYHIEPDPAFERGERMYPMIKGFDRVISISLKRCWHRITRVQPDTLQG